MRWRFPHPAEEGARRAVAADMDRFWRACARGDEPALRAALAALDPRLEVDVDRERLVVSPGADHGLRPLVEALLARAPAGLGLALHAYRPPEALGDVEASLGQPLAGVRASARLDEHGLVTVAVSGALRREAALMAVESLLGDELFEIWVGVVELTAEHPGAPLEELRWRVEAAVDAARERLPAEPSHRWREGRAAVGYSREARSDAGRRADVVAGATLRLDVATGAFLGPVFHSARYSRCGELFAYLQLEGAADRAALEDLCDATLVPAGLGCALGGATGRRHTYVDLALTDAAAAFERLAPALRGRVPGRTWLLFMDGDLAHEWLGVEDATPPPGT